MWKAMASKGRVQEAIDQMLALEKQTRTVRFFFILTEYQSVSGQSGRVY